MSFAHGFYTADSRGWVCVSDSMYFEKVHQYGFSAALPNHEAKANIKLDRDCE